MSSARRHWLSLIAYGIAWGFAGVMNELLAHAGAGRWTRLALTGALVVVATAALRLSADTELRRHPLRLLVPFAVCLIMYLVGSRIFLGR